MSDNKLCPECGTVIPADAPAGQCPQCMLKAGFESESCSEPRLEATVQSPPSSSFEPPSVDSLRELFPQLEILEFVGKGGMGAVYKARQPSLDRFVAVKVLPPEFGRDPAFAERFTREARAMARLSHPNIVAIHNFGQTDGLFYFVMEYIDGANLRHALQAGKLEPKEALAIVPQICDALQFAHDEGIVHRDIKPENVLIDLRGRVKIADFGLAKLLGQEPTEVTLTEANQVMGTLRYMAPEQMQGTHDVDHRADIYSLGVVFYELLTGTVPNGSFDPPSKKVQIDVRLDEVVLRALAREPDKRYQQATEVKTDIEALSSKPAAAAARKPESDDGQAAEVNMESARQEVKVPAIGLMVFGVLPCLMATVLMLFGAGTVYLALGSGSWMSMRLLIGIASILLSLALGAMGITITRGGWKMMNLQSHRLAVTASSFALFPCHPLFLVALGFGIWSLLVLNRPHVKMAFSQDANNPIP